MKNIRQRNDLDIVVQLKNNEGVALDPTLCSDMTVYLTCGTKKFYINDFEKFTDGRIKFRFHAEQQTKLGVYNVTISAVTEDGRTFTTDACNAFNLVACSCNAGDDAGEVNVESVEVDATFEISAWGVVDNTEAIAELERKVNKIVYRWDSFDLSASEGTVSQEVYDNLLKADVVTNNGIVFNAKMVEENSIFLAFYNYGYEESKLLYDAVLITVNSDLTYTIESFGYNLPSENLVDEKLRTKQSTLVSGENIKTINNQSILGEGNITIEGGSANVGITGTLNVTDHNSIAAAQDLITKPYGVAFYLITDSNGKLPSKNQEAVHIPASIEKLLSFRSPNTAVNNILNQVSMDNFKPRGFNVGDIIALSRVPVSIDALVEYLGLSSAIATALKLLGLSEIEIYQYKIWTTNDAKWSNFQNKDGSVVPTGVKGLMSVWDKEQVDKVPRLEANDLSTKYGYGTNFDDCLTTGVCAYSPATIDGVTENFTLIVQASSTVDSGGFYSIIQTAYGRTGSVYNRVFKRMIFYNPTTGAKEPHAWVEITGSSSSVFECSVAPSSVYATLSSNGVNGQARIQSEDTNYGSFVFTGDVFPFTDRNNDSLYIGVGFVYPWEGYGVVSHTQAEPATLIAPNGAEVIIYRHTNDKITALEARINKNVHLSFFTMNEFTEEEGYEYPAMDRNLSKRQVLYIESDQPLTGKLCFAKYQRRRIQSQNRKGWTKDKNRVRRIEGEHTSPHPLFGFSYVVTFSYELDRRENDRYIYKINMSVKLQDGTVKNYSAISIDHLVYIELPGDDPLTVQGTMGDSALMVKTTSGNNRSIADYTIEGTDDDKPNRGTTLKYGFFLTSEDYSNDTEIFPVTIGIDSTIQQNKILAKNWRRWVFLKK